MTKAQRDHVTRQTVLLMLAECVERDLMPVCLVYGQEGPDGQTVVGVLESSIVHSRPGALREALAECLDMLDDPAVEANLVKRVPPGEN